MQPTQSVQPTRARNTNGDKWDLPDLGYGVGLRAAHLEAVRARPAELGFLEILTENYLDPTRRNAQILDELGAQYPLVLHGVSLSIGSCDPLDQRYLERLRALARRSSAAWISDHVCWTGVGGKNTHDLLPLPYDEATLRYVAERARAVADFLERPLVLENPSTYLAYGRSMMPEPEFLSRLCELADCGLLVDVNNVYVSARNQGFDPESYLDALPGERIVQLHLAGHRDRGTHLLDTHDAPIAPAVWALYRRLVARIGKRATLVEWDAALPAFEVLLAELARAREIAAGIEEPRHARVA